MMSYSQYYAQYVKEHEKELNVLFTSYPKGDYADSETTEEINNEQESK